MGVNQWLDLPSDLFGQIFVKLNLFDALLIIPLVCQTWGQILLENIFRKENTILDLMILECEPFNSIFSRLGDQNSRAMKLMNFIIDLMHAFASDSPSDVNNCVIKTTPITKIMFSPSFPLYDRHLVYIAERCPNLKTLHLPCAENITGQGISRALRCWRGIERLYYAPLLDQPLRNRLPRIIEEIGIHCKNLESLTLGFFDLHLQTAEILVQNVKSTKLSLFGVEISKHGLQILLSRCEKLKHIELLSCLFLNSEGMEYPDTIELQRVPEGRGRKWRTDLCPERALELHTSEELANLFWERQRRQPMILSLMNLS